MLCSIPPKSGVGYFHSFCLTDNYIVLTEQPLMIDIWKVLGHRFSASSFEQWLYWDANQLVRFHIIDRKDGNRVGVFTAEPFFVFHHINAFERDDKIFLDACCYYDNSIIKQLYLHNLRSPAEPGHKKLDVPDIRRYEIPLGDLGDVSTEKALRKGGDGLDYSLLYAGLELPRINYEEYNGKPYRWVEDPRLSSVEKKKINKKTATPFTAYLRVLTRELSSNDNRGDVYAAFIP